MTPITNALFQGYSEDDIIKYLKKLAPKLSAPIQSATINGYNSKQILGFINRLMEEKTIPKGMSPNEIEGMKTKQRNQLAKDILGTAATAIGGAAIAKQIPKAIKGLSTAIKGIGPKPMANAPTSTNAPQSLTEPQGMQPPSPITPEAAQRKQIVENPAIADPEFREWVKAKIEAGEERPIEEMFKEFHREKAKARKSSPLMQGIAHDVEKMQAPSAQIPKPSEAPTEEFPVDKEGNPLGYRDWLKYRESTDWKRKEEEHAKIPETIKSENEEVQRTEEKAIKKEHPEFAKFLAPYRAAIKGEKHEYPSDRKITTILNDIHNDRLSEEQRSNPYVHKIKELYDQGKIKSEEDIHRELEKKGFLEATGKPEKGMIVATPNGEVGDLKDVRKTEGLVDEDGKLHKTKLKDIQLPDEHVVQTVARLLEIPEIEKSSLINYWAYDPEDKELIAMYHNGETYKYLEVPEELESQLLEAATMPKTSGENVFGAWAEEDPMSRGATLSKLLIQHPKYKRAKKGEKENPYYRKLRKGYDYWTKLRK